MNSDTNRQILAGRRNGLPLIPAAITLEKEEKNRHEVSVIHKLKLEWMMAKDEGERRAISEEIRRRLFPSKK